MGAVHDTGDAAAVEHQASGGRRQCAAGLTGRVDAEAVAAAGAHRVDAVRILAEFTDHVGVVGVTTGGEDNALRGVVLDVLVFFLGDDAGDGAVGSLDNVDAFAAENQGGTGFGDGLGQIVDIGSARDLAFFIFVLVPGVVLVVAHGAGSLELHADALQPGDVLAGLVHVAAEQRAVGIPVMIVHRGGEQVIAEIGRVLAVFLLDVAVDGEEAFGEEGGAAGDAALLEQDGVHAELGRADRRGHTAAAGADDHNVKVSLFGDVVLLLREIASDGFIRRCGFLCRGRDADGAERGDHTGGGGALQEGTSADFHCHR